MPEMDELIEQMNNLEATSEVTANNLERWKSNVSGTVDFLSNMSERASDLNSVLGGSTVNAGMTKREIKALADELNKARKGAEGIKIDSSAIASFGDIAKIAKNFSIDPKSLKEGFRGISDTLSGTVNEILETFDEMKGYSDNATASVVTSFAAMGLSLANVKVFEKLEEKLKYNTFQKQLKNMEKSALSLGMTFGKSFTEAAASTSEFQNSMLKTQSTLFATQESILDIRKNLATAFSAQQVSSAMLDVQDAFTGVSAAANLTNAVILTSKATGMDEAKVAGMMAEAHLELGLSAEKAAMSMGFMRDAGKGSGLAFDKVSDGIFSSAKLLKFYGGTIESVTPLFKRFNESLKGIGREGLTPELLKDFTSGLQQMSLSTRSLLSLSAPGMATGAGGMLGGGLAMEKAMEEGDMETVAKSITETIKKYSGGGPILTREQALENPAMTRAYIIQRQMLGQLTKISDPGKQNMMLEVLKNVDKNGLDSSSDMKKSFSELMESGEKVTKETTTDLEKAQQQHQANVISRADTIIDVAKGILENTSISGTMRGVERALQVTAGFGVPNMKTVSGALNGERISEEEMGVIEKAAETKPIRTNQIKLGEARAQNMAESSADIYKKKIAEAFQDPKNIAAFRKFQKTGIVDQDIQKRAFEESTTDLQKRISEIKKISSRKQTVAQRTELSNLLATKEFLRAGGPRQEKYTGSAEGRTEWEKQQIDQRKQFFAPALEAAQLKREQDLAKMSPEDRIRAKLGTIDAGQKAPLPQQLAPIPGIERGRTRIGVDQDELASITLSPEELRKRQVKEQFGKVVASSTASFAGPSLKDTMNAENITRVTRQEQMKQGSTEKQEPRDIKVNSEVVVRFEGLENVRADVKTIAEEVSSAENRGQATGAPIK